MAGEGLSAEICTVGTELLLGQTVDTNAAFIARQLANAGVNVYYRTGVGDNPDRMESVFRDSLTRSDVLVVTGGLGPTQDDLTAATLARVFDRPMVLDADTDRRIRARVSRLALKVGESTYRQAMVPAGALILQNEVGTAPGIWLEREGKVAVALPGVPVEMEDLMVRRVIPLLQQTAHSGSVIRSRVLRLVGITESLAEERILDLVKEQTNPTVAPYAGSGEVKLRITARAPDEPGAIALLSAMELVIRERLGPFIYGADEETLAFAVGRLLLERGLTVATAESCTAGLLSAALTEMPGSSAYLFGGVVAYSNLAKERVVGVSPEVIAAHGAVSVESAEALADGVRRLYGADLGVSITGIAGPGGGGEAKPVGLVYFGLADGHVVRAERRQFGSGRGGSRSDIRKRSVNVALQLLFRRLQPDAAS